MIDAFFIHTNPLQYYENNSGDNLDLFNVNPYDKIIAHRQSFRNINILKQQEIKM